MTMFLHHVQVSGPAGCEDAMRGFYAEVLGLVEIPKPERLRSRGGAWFRGVAPDEVPAVEIHVGIEDPFAPARKAHPGIAVSDVEALAGSVAAAGRPVTWDDNIPGLRRFHTTDPVGNRLEFQQADVR